MSEETTQISKWTDNLTASAVKACKSKAEAISSHVSNAQRQFVLAAIDAEIVYRHYLQGSKDRLVSYFAEEVEGVKPSMAYTYVQAGRTYRLRDTLGLTKAQCDAMSVHALAQLDRYATSSDEEKVAEGKMILQADAEASEAARAEGKTRKPLTKEGLLEVAQAVRGDAPDPADKVERRTGNIESKMRDEYRLTFASAEAIRQDPKQGPQAAFAFVAKYFAEAGATYGALTPQAIDRLDTAWLTDRRLAAVAAEKKRKQAERDAAKRAKLAADVATLTDAPTPKPDPTITSAPKPKRSNRKPRVTNSPARASK